MAPRYGVIGHPIAHSCSPQLHLAFAQRIGCALQFKRILSPLDGFESTVNQFRQHNGSGLSVTAPFKEAAYAYAERYGSLTRRAVAAGAVNRLTFYPQHVLGDNTDGIGLVRDLSLRLKFRFAAATVLLIGAGGAARSALAALLATKLRFIYLTNRTPERGMQLAARYRDCRVRYIALESLNPVRATLILNTASASSLSVPLFSMLETPFKYCKLAYDLSYTRPSTEFLRQAASLPVPLISDGCGLLIAQAAEAFYRWHGVFPPTEGLYQQLQQWIDPLVAPLPIAPE